MKSTGQATKSPIPDLTPITFLGHERRVRRVSCLMDEISLSPAKRLKRAEGGDLRGIRSAENFSGIVEKEERRIIQLKGTNQLDDAGEEDIRKRSGRFLFLF